MKLPPAVFALIDPTKFFNRVDDHLVVTSAEKVAECKTLRVSRLPALYQQSCKLSHALRYVVIPFYPLLQEAFSEEEDHLVLFSQ